MTVVTENSIPLGFKFCECGLCNELIPVRDRRGRPRRFRNGHSTKGKKSNRDQWGENNPSWRGGKYNHENYEHVKNYDHPNRDQDNYIGKHVDVFTEFYQCCMLKWGIVHHRKPVKEGGTNDIENLEGMTKPQHTALHNKTTRIYKRKHNSNTVCLLCGNKETRISKRGCENWYAYQDGYICAKCWNKLPEQREKGKLRTRKYRKKKNEG